MLSNIRSDSAGTIHFHIDRKAKSEGAAVIAPRQINMQLEANARDSLQHAVQSLAWKDFGSNDARLKQAISNVAHAIELFFKARVSRINPSLVWLGGNPSPGRGGKSINTAEAEKILTTQGGLSFALEDLENLKALREMRNDIQHHSWKTTEKDAKEILARALSFVLDFASIELDLDLTEDFLKDSTWEALLDENPKFVLVHGVRLEARFLARGEFPSCCNKCGQLTVPMYGGFCKLCGCYQSNYDI